MCIAFRWCGGFHHCLSFVFLHTHPGWHAGMPYELVAHHDPCHPLLIGGLGQGEEKLGMMKVRGCTVSFICFCVTVICVVDRAREVAAVWAGLCRCSVRQTCVLIAQHSTGSTPRRQPDNTAHDWSSLVCRQQEVTMLDHTQLPHTHPIRTTRPTPSALQPLIHGPCVTQTKPGAAEASPLVPQGAQDARPARVLHGLAPLPVAARLRAGGPQQAAAHAQVGGCVWAFLGRLQWHLT